MDPDTESVVSHVQRKIELQSLEDLTFLIGNARRAATARLDEAFPPSASASNQAGGDDLRNQIGELVDEYIQRTFSLAAPNLCINGLPVPPDAVTRQFATDAASPSQRDPAYEPFDARKRTRLAELVATQERLLEEVAQLKRSVPPTVAHAAAARARDESERDEELLEQRRRRVEEQQQQSDDASLLLPPLQRQQTVEQTFRAAVQGLDRLKTDMPAVIAKMERARVAGDYVVGGTK